MAFTATLSIEDNDVAALVWVETVQNCVEGESNGYVRIMRDNTENEITVGFTLDYKNGGYYSNNVQGRILGNRNQLFSHGDTVSEYERFSKRQWKQTGNLKHGFSEKGHL